MLLQVPLSHSFYGRVIFHHTYVPHLRPFLCQCTFRLLPWLGCCRLCCSEHWVACILLDHVFFPPDKCPRLGLQGHVVALFLVF